MGVNFNLFKIDKKKFVDVYFFYSLKKNKINVFFNTFILGFKNNFSIIYPEILVEQSKRIFLFCFNLIMNQGFFLFTNFNKLFLKNYIFFLACRSLQTIIHTKWVNGLLTNCLWKSPPIFIVSKLNNFLILKETFIKKVPLILINNNILSLDKSFYLIFSNLNSKKYMFFYYKNLSNFIILSKLYFFTIKLLNSKVKK